MPEAEPTSQDLKGAHGGSTRSGLSVASLALQVNACAGRAAGNTLRHQPLEQVFGRVVGLPRICQSGSLAALIRRQDLIRTTKQSRAVHRVVMRRVIEVLDREISARSMKLFSLNGALRKFPLARGHIRPGLQIKKWAH